MDALDQLDNPELPKADPKPTQTTNGRKPLLRDQDLEPLQLDPSKLVRGERNYTFFMVNDLPEKVIAEFIEVGRLLEAKWFTFRHTAESYRKDQNRIIKMLEKRGEGYLLWKGANGEFPTAFPGPTEKAHRITQTLTNFYGMVRDGEFREKYNMPVFMQDILARNTMLFLGKEIDTPINLLVCYSPDGAENKNEKIEMKTPAVVGGAIELADQLSIPVFNLGKPGAMDRIKAFVEKI